MFWFKLLDHNSIALSQILQDSATTASNKNHRHTIPRVWIEASIDAEGVKSVAPHDNRESADAHSSSSSARLTSNVESRGHMDSICDSKARWSFRK